MSIDTRLIDEIVAGVLRQLGAPVAASNNPPSLPADSSDQTLVDLQHKVITGDLLDANAAGAKHVRLAAGAVITPTGRDWLRKRRVAWETAKTQQGVKTHGWRLLVVSTTPAIDQLSEQIVTEGWNRQLAGDADEAADGSVSTLCRGEANGVVVISHAPERVACRANRNAQVRGAAVRSVSDVQRVRADLNANLFAISPEGKSYFELRTLLRTIAQR